MRESDDHTNRQKSKTSKRSQITEELLEGWFRGFASQTLWPLLHGFLAHTRFDNTWWRDYVEAPPRAPAASAGVFLREIDMRQKA